MAALFCRHPARCAVYDHILQNASLYVFTILYHAITRSHCTNFPLWKYEIHRPRTFWGRKNRELRHQLQRIATTRPLFSHCCPEIFILNDSKFIITSLISVINQALFEQYEWECIDRVCVPLVLETINQFQIPFRFRIRVMHERICSEIGCRSRVSLVLARSLREREIALSVVGRDISSEVGIDF